MELHEIASTVSMEEEQMLEDLPEIVENSELQHDSDIACYLNSWPEQSLATDIRNLKRHLEVKRLLSGSAVLNAYTTRGDKAGRDDIAQVQQYQETRSVSDPAKKARVEELRMFLGEYETDTIKPKPQWEIEADDAMSIRQRECMAQGITSKIMTIDKDLDMVPGIHIHPETYEEKVHPDEYGSIWVVEKGELKSKGGNGIKREVKGMGHAFFWAQLLMGDKADHIPGLPKLSVELLNEYKPTQAIKKAIKVLNNPKASGRARNAAKGELTKRNPAPCGAMTAWLLLGECRSNREAYKIVRRAYNSWYGTGNFQFKTWRGETKTLTSGDMLLEQARLLWMLRTQDDDVLDFFRTVIV